MNVSSIKVATPELSEAISVLVNSAYRGESGRQGWTTEAGLLEGLRTDPDRVRDLMTTEGSVVLVKMASAAVDTDSVEGDRAREAVVVGSQPALADGVDDRAGSGDRAAARVGVAGGAGAPSGAGHASAGGGGSRAGAVIACVHLEKKDATTAYLGMLTTDITRQSQGTGKEMMNASEEYVRKVWHCSRIEMTVIDTRHELISYYVRRGYRVTDEKRPFPSDPRFGIPLAGPIEFVVLEKDL